MKIPVDVGRLLESLGIEARKRHDEWFALCPDPDHDDRRPDRDDDDRGPDNDDDVGGGRDDVSGQCLQRSL